MTNTAWTVLAGLTLALLGWLASVARNRIRDALDRRRVRQWLLSNTRDEPGESHTDTATLAKGTRLTDERVRRACMSDPRVHRLSDGRERWSVWRQEAQSIYEKRGPLVL
jgi:hypothetical protein